MRRLILAGSMQRLTTQNNIEAWVNVAGSLLGESLVFDRVWKLMRRCVESHDSFPVW